jgi:hypothetical protein
MNQSAFKLLDGLQISSLTPPPPLGNLPVTKCPGVGVIFQIKSFYVLKRVTTSEEVGQLAILKMTLKNRSSLFSMMCTDNSLSHFS